jgi:glycosyltransferase involved in cell wall biosynthesis
MFTVVIPLFNKGPYVERALDSIDGQSHAADEIIVVNDGSTDGGDRLVRSRGDARLRVIDQPNRGVSAARNAGVAAATHPFVAFLDADDRWRPGLLARMRGLIGTHPAAVLYGAGFVTVAADGSRHRHGIAPAGPGDTGRIVDYFAERCRGHVLHMSTTVARRSAVEAVGGFPEGVAYCEDEMLWSRLALAGLVVLSPEALAEYDVGVPGQAVEYWSRAYRERLDVLDYHRFLAAEVWRHGGSRPALVALARRELTTALLQRIYRGNFAASEALWREAHLDGLPLGPVAAACGFVVRHPGMQPAVAALMGLARRLRG